MTTVETYLFIRFIVDIPVRSPVIILILVILIFILIVLVEIILVHIVTQFFELKSLASEPVNRARYKLFFDILAKLVVQFEALFDIGGNGIVVISGRLWRREEVEKGLSRNGDLDNSSLLGI